MWQNWLHIQRDKQTNLDSFLSHEPSNDRTDGGELRREVAKIHLVSFSIKSLSLLIQLILLVGSIVDFLICKADLKISYFFFSIFLFNHKPPYEWHSWALQRPSPHPQSECSAPERARTLQFRFQCFILKVYTSDNKVAGRHDSFALAQVLLIVPFHVEGFFEWRIGVDLNEWMNRSFNCKPWPYDPYPLKIVRKSERQR